MLPAAHAPNAPDTRPDTVQDVVRRLRDALQPDLLQRELSSDWAYLDNARARLTGCCIERVHDHGSHGYIVEYAMVLESDSGSRIVKVFGQIPAGDPELHYSDLLISLRSSRRRQLSKKHPTTRISLHRGLRMILRFPGLDERIFGLRLLAGLPQSAAPIQGADELRFARAVLLAHRLGKRCVIRLWNGEPNGQSARSTIVKFYKERGRKSCETVELMEHLSTAGFGRGGSIRLPQVVRKLPATQGFVMEDLPGVPVADLEASRLANGALLAGETLACLHGAPVAGIGSFGPGDELALVRRSARLVSRVFPQRAAEFAAVLKEVEHLVGQARAFEPVLVHRDFHEKQVLVDGDRAGLIDLDTACLGDPAQDIGNFLAHLDLRESQGHSGAQALIDSFLEGYDRVRKPPAASRIDAHRKSTLFRLACMHVFRPDAQQLTANLLRSI